MKVYAVQRMDKYDYDFSVTLRKYGCFTNKEKAKEIAKLAYKQMREECEDDIKQYSNENEYRDVDEGALEVEEDDENGYYRISFGFEENYEVHNVAVNELNLEFNETDEYKVYRKVKREYLIEDIKAKAEEMEQSLDGIDIERLADYAERSLDHNDYYYECYWDSIEYALEHI